MSDEKLKVLVVEDERSIQEFLMMIFEEAGAEVLCAAAVPQAKEILDTHPDIDVVTLDGSLAVGHGSEVAEHIVKVLWPRQAEAACGKTAFVVISGNPFTPEGVSAVYEKGSQTVSQIKGFEGGTRAWLRHMKSLVPA
ncbi:MAG: response regulator [Alphaproteobacteria bacterium]|nr:response regulator [Alphaproteobacteria bacterium]